MSLRELATISALTLLPTPIAAAQSADLGNRDAMPQGQTPAMSVREIIESSLRFETLFGLFDFGPPPDYLDQTEFGWARFEGDQIAPASWGLWPGRQSTGGMHLISDRGRYGEGVWLRARDQDTLSVRVLVSSRGLVMGGA